MESISGNRLQNLLQTILQCQTPDEAQQVLKREDDHVECLFETVDWDQLRRVRGDRSLRFPRLNWGKRTLLFVNCDVGDGDFAFSGTFVGQVVFHEVAFGEGNISFAGSVFRDLDIKNLSCRGKGEISFAGTTIQHRAQLIFGDLGSKSLNFEPHPGQDKSSGTPSVFSGESFKLVIGRSRAERIDFSKAVFSATKVDLDFAGAECLRRLNFSASIWTTQMASITGIRLNHKEHQQLAFTFADFEKVHSLVFNQIGMIEGSMAFSFVTFPRQGRVMFIFSDLGEGQIVFDQSVFPCSVSLRQDAEARFSSELSFRGSTFEGPLSIDGLQFGPVPDLIGTEFRKHLNLSDVTFGVNRTRGQKRSEVSRGAKLRRIKELAEGNKDHALALSCHAEEMRFNRFRKHGFGNFLADSLDVVYECASNYGQSIALPILWLAFSWASFGLLYRYLFDNIESPLLFSFAWTFPFLPAAGVLRLIGFRDIFQNAEPALYALTGMQGLIAIALLFLVGLGFRNRFRI